MTRIGYRSTGRPTLNEVARLAAVSPITASRALRGVATVAPELVEKVRAAAQSLGYVANPAARALASVLTGFDHTPAARQMLETSGVPCVHMMELDARRGAYCVGLTRVCCNAAQVFVRCSKRRGCLTLNCKS